MQDQHLRKAYSFEQDLLWSVLDQDAVPYVLELARDRWNLDANTAYDILKQQAALGRVRTYRGTGPFTPVDLAKASLDAVLEDYELFMEPTDATLARLREIALTVAR